MSAEHPFNPEQKGEKSKHNDESAVNSRRGFFKVLGGAAAGILGVRAAEAQTMNPVHYGPMSRKEYPKAEKVESAQDKARDMKAWLKAIDLNRAEVEILPQEGRELVAKHSFTIRFKDERKDEKGKDFGHIAFVDSPVGENLTSKVFYEKFKVLLVGGGPNGEGPSQFLKDISDEDKKVLVAKIDAQLAGGGPAAREGKAKEAPKVPEYMKDSLGMANDLLKRYHFDEQIEALPGEENPQHQVINFKIKGQDAGVVLTSRSRMFTKPELVNAIPKIIRQMQDGR